jgi:2-(3-amino-3-carboxypropyl)histidine synthase
MMEERTIKGIKTIFVPAEVKSINLIRTLEKLKIKKKRIGLVSAIQYLKYLKEAKKFLEKKGYKVFIGGQMVGCNISNAVKIKNKVDSFVFIGSGEFHPLGLADLKKVIYFVNPYTEKVSKFDEKELEKKRKGKLSKYLMAKKIGIIVSTKPGQESLKVALKFAENCGKEAYIFICDEVDVIRLEDFNDIEMWVNTACPRIEAKNIIALRDVLKQNL